MVSKHITNNVHGGLIGVAQSQPELTLNPKFRQPRRNLWATAVNHNRLYPHVAQVGHILSKGFLERLINHCIAAKLYNHDAIVKLA